MQYPAGTPASGSDVKQLTDHIKICPSHPMRAAEEKIKKLRDALIGLVGATDRKELEAMKAVLENFPGIPDAEKKNTINAINAVIETGE
jgi:hypothetical protein